MEVKTRDRWRRAGALTAAIALTFAIAACGGDDDPDPVATKPTTTSAAPAGKKPIRKLPATRLPQGPLADTAIGPLHKGDRYRKALGLWGKPDKRYVRTQCELGFPYSPQIISATWKTADGEASLHFLERSRKFSMYRVTTSELATAEGVRVGDSFEALRAADPDLRPISVGIETTGEEGYWVKGKDSDLRRLYEIKDGRITVISGGTVSLCE